MLEIRDKKMIQTLMIIKEQLAKERGHFVSNTDVVKYLLKKKNNDKVYKPKQLMVINE